MSNKFKKLALTTIIGSCLGATVVIPSNAYSFAGIMDINVMETLTYLQNTLREVQSSISSKMAAEAPQKSSENDAKVQEALVKAQSKIQTLHNNIPDLQSCDRLVSNSSVLSSGGAASSYVAKNLAEQAQKDKNKGESLAQTKSKQANAKKLNCTESDVQKGIYGCTESSLKTAGMNRNPQILNGSGFVSGGTNGSKAVMKNSGEVITHTQMGDGTAYNGVESAKNYVESMFGNDPMELISKDANNSQAGSMYNQVRDAYMNRKNLAKSVMLKQIAKTTEMEDADVSSDIKSLWNSSDVSDVLSSMNGGKEKYVKPKNPSQKEILNYVVNKAFTASSTALNNLGKNGSEAQMLAIQSKIMLEQLDAMQDQNKILSALLAQQMNPINVKDLDEMRVTAEQSGLGTSK